MKIYVLLLVLALSSCATSPLRVKDRHFNAVVKDYTMDSDLKEVIFKALERAYVTFKDVPDYDFFEEKDRFYITNEYQAFEVENLHSEEIGENIEYLKLGDVPNFVDGIQFCLKSKEELQEIADKTKEDILRASFSLLEINGNKATVKIQNTWVVSKYSELKNPGGSGYTCVYAKVNGVWQFDSLVGTWAA